MVYRREDLLVDDVERVAIGGEGRWTRIRRSTFPNGKIPHDDIQSSTLIHTIHTHAQPTFSTPRQLSRAGRVTRTTRSRWRMGERNLKLLNQGQALGGSFTCAILTRSGVYADIVLQLPATDVGLEHCRGVQEELLNGLRVIKVVQAPRNGVDSSRLPHNIVLEVQILQQVNHLNVSLTPALKLWTWSLISFRSSLIWATSTTRSEVYMSYTSRSWLFPLKISWKAPCLIQTSASPSAIWLNRLSQGCLIYMGLESVIGISILGI